jgi:hypothetical protein
MEMSRFLKKYDLCLASSMKTPQHPCEAQKKRTWRFGWRMVLAAGGCERKKPRHCNQCGGFNA